VSLAPGDVVSVITPGSGGYGPPSERDRRLVEADLLEGKVTPAGARAYGHSACGESGRRQYEP
jgi:N-methylhydantoinase B